jgi:tetratricopeptide (TPR) repeat protein
LALAFSRVATPAELGQLDANPTLFTALAALNASGFFDAQSPNAHPLKEEVRAEVLKRNPASLPALKKFFEAHRKPNDTAEFSQYVSYALSVSGPPDFAFKGRDVEIPPDVLPLKELSPLLARFYKEAGMEDLWRRSQPAIDQYIARYHEPISDAVLKVNAYLRQPTSGLSGRRFQVFIELLAPPNQVQTRTYGVDYSIVVTPSPELRTADIRHAYLHYSLDFLAPRNKEVLDRKKPIGDHAQRAIALDQVYKDDFLELATESLIKAVEARLDRRPNDVDRALHQGFVLTPYFSEQLPIYEKQEQDFSLFYPTMAKALDVMKEEQRLANVEFERQAALRPIVKPAVPPAPASPAAKSLQDAEKLYNARAQDPGNLDKAKELYLSAVEGSQGSLQAAAYYGLARIAALQNDPETAERLFSKTLELQPEPQVKGWSLIYLGRLSVAAGEADEAKRYFEEALKVQGASDAARKAATEGLQGIQKQ